MPVALHMAEVERLQGERDAARANAEMALDTLHWVIYHARNESAAQNAARRTFASLGYELTASAPPSDCPDSKGQD